MLDIASNGVDGSHSGCMWWYIAYGLVLAIIIFLTMRWSSGYTKEMYEEKEGHG